MNENNTRPRRGGRRELLLLLLIFAMPFFAAWYIYNYTSYGRGEATGNYGELVLPPIALSDMTLTGGQGEEVKLHGKWTLLLLADGPCDTRCERLLDMLVTVRQGLGSSAARFQLALSSPPGADAARRIYGMSTADSKLVRNSYRQDRDLPDISAPLILLIDPLGNLMMSYPSAADSQGILGDIKRLLRYSRIG